MLFLLIEAKCLMDSLEMYERVVFQPVFDIQKSEETMEKKALVDLMTGIALMILMLQGVFQCSTYNKVQIMKGKEQIILHQPVTMEKEEYIQTLLQCSDKTHTDLMYERYDEKMTRLLYKTNQSEDFFHIDTEKGSILLEKDETLSTHGEQGVKKIYGIHFPGEEIVIRDFSKIKEFDLSSGRFWMESDKIPDFCRQLDQLKIAYDRIGGIYLEDEEEPLWQLSIAFSLFMGITIVMYAFSKMKDYAIKKTMGYSKLLIWWLEIKNIGITLLFESFGLTTVFFLILMVLFEVETGLLWLKLIIVPVVRLIAVYTFFVAISTGYAGMRSSILHIKGKRQDMILGLVVAGFRMAVFAICTLTISKLVFFVSWIYQIYRTTENMKEKLIDYATITECIAIENPEEDYEAYDKKLCDFYQILHEERGAIIADTSEASMMDIYGPNPEIYINDHYLDFSERIFDMQGNRITSENLEKGKYNVLVPEGVEYDPVASGLCRVTGLSPEQVRVIEYCSDSVFFSFDNLTCSETGGYFQNPIAEVFDETMIADQTFRALMLETFCINGLYFKVNSGKNAYEDIFPVVKQCGLTNLFMEASLIGDRWNQNLKSLMDDWIQNCFVLILYLFAWVVLLMYSAQIYFNNHAKDISAKLIQGYSLLEITKIRLAVECLVLVVLAGISFVESVFFSIAFLLLGVDLICFYLVVKEQCRKNLTDAMKGEY